MLAYGDRCPRSAGRRAGVMSAVDFDNKRTTTRTTTSVWVVTAKAAAPRVSVTTVAA
jgi:hypothetical protein